MTLTDATKKQLIKKMTHAKKEMALTIGYVNCGCVGMQLSIDVQKIKPRATRHIREEVDGFTVIYDLAAVDLVKDAVIDFDNRLFNYGYHCLNNIDKRP